MSLLLEHLKRMQAMCAAYLDPGSNYRSHDGMVATLRQAHRRDEMFIHDIIYMLDGPEQREAQNQAELVLKEGYPTEDAYLGVCRALHWRTEQLRQAGIEPLNLMDESLQPLTHYPPDDFRFPVMECFPRDDHRQVYHAWRRFPRAMQASVAMGVVVAFPLGVLITLLIRG